ncbi:hypothetical protein DFH07DRAFT_989097 [Mycena maculata]|uniref:Uncharacterized protein n=1 Tax=Mycena maculata TaxID=230809 RepID=A0AAD7I3H3_9AGAR|nr:hypothetical protein DFH07DRAFT_989097 [Mycena maculata]
MPDASLPPDMESNFRSELMAAASVPPPLTPGLTMVPAVETNLPRPFFDVPPYPLHGLPFEALPTYSQHFLAFNGLHDPAAATPEWMECVRQFLTKSLVDGVADLCRQIVTANVLYNANSAAPGAAALVMHVRRELLPQLEAQLSHHLMLADALVWVDVSARADGPDALDAEEARRYRALQTQPAVDLVTDQLVNLYGWLAQMWNAGWRMDSNKVLYRLGAPLQDVPEGAAPLGAVAPAPEPVTTPVDAPVPSQPSPPSRPSTPRRRPDTPIPQSTAPADVHRSPPSVQRPRTRLPTSPPRSTPRTVPLRSLTPTPRTSRTTAQSPPCSPGRAAIKKHRGFDSLPNRSTRPVVGAFAGIR